MSDSSSSDTLLKFLADASEVMKSALEKPNSGQHRPVNHRRYIYWQLLESQTSSQTGRPTPRPSSEVAAQHRGKAAQPPRRRVVPSLKENPASLEAPLSAAADGGSVASLPAGTLQLLLSPSAVHSQPKVTHLSRRYPVILPRGPCTLADTSLPTVRAPPCVGNMVQGKAKLKKKQRAGAGSQTKGSSPKGGTHSPGAGHNAGQSHEEERQRMQRQCEEALMSQQCLPQPTYHPAPGPALAPMMAPAGSNSIRQVLTVLPSSPCLLQQQQQQQPPSVQAASPLPPYCSINSLQPHLAAAQANNEPGLPSDGRGGMALGESVGEKHVTRLNLVVEGSNELNEASGCQPSQSESVRVTMSTGTDYQLPGGQDAEARSRGPTVMFPCSGGPPVECSTHSSAAWLPVSPTMGQTLIAPNIDHEYLCTSDIPVTSELHYSLTLNDQGHVRYSNTAAPTVNETQENTEVMDQASPETWAPSLASNVAELDMLSWDLDFPLLSHADHPEDLPLRESIVGPTLQGLDPAWQPHAEPTYQDMGTESSSSSSWTSEASRVSDNEQVASNEVDPGSQYPQQLFGCSCPAGQDETSQSPSDGALQADRELPQGLPSFASTFLKQAPVIPPSETFSTELGGKH